MREILIYRYTNCSAKVCKKTTRRRTIYDLTWLCCYRLSSSIHPPSLKDVEDDTLKMIGRGAKEMKIKLNSRAKNEAIDNFISIG